MPVEILGNRYCEPLLGAVVAGSLAGAGSLVAAAGSDCLTSTSGIM